jgi:phthalate 4,5-cis-dihydrodiol dehydrogenase
VILSSTFDQTPLGLGVAGLGRGFMLTAPSLIAHGGVRLVAAAAPRAATRAAFEAEFGGRAYSDIADLCADPSVEAVYIATPHQMHADHVACAAQAGKAVLVDKPLAITLEDGARMVADTRRAGVPLIVGPSHSFDGPVQVARDLIQSGRFGKVRMIQALNYTDFLYRPRRPEELVTDAGGGVLFSQAVHQVDVVRLLAGTRARSVTALTGAWDPARPTEGAYSALIAFDGGAFASLTYSGYAHFDSDGWMDWVGELGQPKDPNRYGAVRRALASVTSGDAETALKRQRALGGEPIPPPTPHHEHFGPVIVSMDRADLQLTPGGVKVHGDLERSFHPAPDWPAPRQGVIDALISAVRGGHSVTQDGAWGLASLELCHAILASARGAGAAVALRHQGDR